MKLLGRFCYTLIFCFSFLISFSQTDTCHLRISLLTCGPGNELYSTFGHTAIRIIDSSNKLDVVFNYGIFDDSDPYFYIKFARGIMRYQVAGEYFKDFMEEYVEDKRSVAEQELQLSCTEKINLLNALKENSRDDKKYYDYQFYKDNCTIRAKDMIKKSTDQSIIFKNILPAKAPPSFRQLIHDYLDNGNHSWSKFGIDLLLGSHLDDVATNEQAMFLPDYLMKGFDSATIHQQKLVSDKKIILSSGTKKAESFSWLSPFFIFSLVAIVIILLSFNNSASTKKILNAFDIVFFFFIGLLGILIAFEWLGRVDEVCRNNMNILWAWPTHVVAAFLINKKTKFIKNYFRFAALIALILLIGWFWWHQQFNNSFAPLLVLIIVRGFFISTKK